MVWVFGDKITKQPIKVSSFEGSSTCIVGFVNLDLIICQEVNRFHVINARTSYHLLVRRLDSLSQAISTYHQCLKVFWKASNSTSMLAKPPSNGMRYVIGHLLWRANWGWKNTSLSTSMHTFAHMGRPRGLWDQTWNFAFTSSRPPRALKQQQSNDKKRYRGGDGP